MSTTTRPPFVYVVPDDEPGAAESTAWLERVAETPIRTIDVPGLGPRRVQLAVFDSPREAWEHVPLALWKPGAYDRAGRHSIERPNTDCRSGFADWPELRTALATSTPSAELRERFARALREHADPGAVAAALTDTTRRAWPVWSDDGDEPDADRCNARAEDWALSIRRGHPMPTVRIGMNTFVGYSWQTLDAYQTAAVIGYTAATAAAELGFGVEFWACNAAEQEHSPALSALGTAYRLCRADEPLDPDTFACASTPAGHKMLTWAMMNVAHDWYRRAEIAWEGNRRSRTRTETLRAALDLDYVIDGAWSPNAGTLADITGGILRSGLTNAIARAQQIRTDWATA